MAMRIGDDDLWADEEDLRCPRESVAACRSSELTFRKELEDSEPSGWPQGTPSLWEAARFAADPGRTSRGSTSPAGRCAMCSPPDRLGGTGKGRAATIGPLIMLGEVSHSELCARRSPQWQLVLPPGEEQPAWYAELLADGWKRGMPLGDADNVSDASSPLDADTPARFFRTVGSEALDAELFGGPTWGQEEPFSLLMGEGEVSGDEGDLLRNAACRAGADKDPADGEETPPWRWKQLWPKRTGLR